MEENTMLYIYAFKFNLVLVLLELSDKYSELLWSHNG